MKQTAQAFALPYLKTVTMSSLHPMHGHIAVMYALLTWSSALLCRYLCTLGVPRLRQIFLDVFGHHTASNNGGWLRRKLAEPAEGGRGRALQIRARDASAAIWTTGKVRGVTKVSVLDLSGKHNTM